MTVYLSSFFSLPIKTSSGQYLSHEQVVAKLDDETVAYENEVGIQGYFGETIRVGISVEKEKYEVAVRWMKDLLYGAEFDISRYFDFLFTQTYRTYRNLYEYRLQVTCAKILQGLPELKRDGNTMLSSYSAELLYDQTSTARTNAISGQMKAIPELVKMLQENPEQVRKDFEEIRKHSKDHLIS